jgi:hypothetical protein
MSKHTPGPWSAERSPVFLHQTNITTPEGPIATVYGTSGENAANVALIASAPEMLEVLRTTAGNIRSLGPAGAIEPFTPYLEWLRVVEEVIAQAEGRT